MSRAASPVVAWLAALAVPLLTAASVEAQSDGLGAAGDSGIFVPGGESSSVPGDDYKPEPKPDPKSEPKSEPKSDPKSDPKPDPGAEADAEAPKDGAEPAGDDKSDGGTDIKDVEQRLEVARSDIRSLRDQVAANARAIQELRMLLESDRDAEPKPNEDLVPLDADCKGDMSCVYCLMDVQDEMDELALLFEKLQLIYSRYKDTYDYAVAFGDAASGFHGASGLAWNSVKIGLLKGLKQLQSAYDDKYDEFMAKEIELLKAADACLPPGAPPISTSIAARTRLNMLAIAYKRKD